MSTQQHVVTEATAATEAELLEATALFFGQEYHPFTFVRCGGGVNNKCYKIASVPKGDVCVLRIYNNGFNTDRVRYEHEVLRQLHDSKHNLAKSLLPIQLPHPRTVPSSNITYVKLSSTTEACVFDLIPGTIPSLSSSFRIGQATAQLVIAMSHLKLDELDFPCPNPLYRDIYRVHHKINRALFFHIVVEESAHAFSNTRIAELLDKLQSMESLLHGFDSLPVQQIHGDLHVDNVLVHEGTDHVSGILDFEFTSRDWRVMELVVGLSKYVGLQDPTECISQYVQGYRAGGGRLSLSEQAAVSDLVILRILSNFVYFVGRACAGEDSLNAAVSRVDLYMKRIDWIHEHHVWFATILGTFLT